MLAMGAYPHIISLTPAKKPAAVRLLIKDMVSGHLGSISIPLEPHAAIPRAGDSAGVPR